MVRTTRTKPTFLFFLFLGWTFFLSWLSRASLFSRCSHSSCKGKDNSRMKSTTINAYSMGQNNSISLTASHPPSKNTSSKITTCIKDIYLQHFAWNCPQVTATRSHRRWVAIGLGNGLVPSGTKPLPEPMLTQFYVSHSVYHPLCRGKPLVSIVNVLDKVYATS